MATRGPVSAEKFLGVSTLRDVRVYFGGILVKASWPLFGFFNLGFLRNSNKPPVIQGWELPVNYSTLCSFGFDKDIPIAHLAIRGTSRNSIADFDMRKGTLAQMGPASIETVIHIGQQHCQDLISSVLDTEVHENVEKLPMTTITPVETL